MPLAPLTRWLRPALTLVALAGTLALTACGGGSGAVNAPNQPGPTPIPAMSILPAGVVVAYSQVPTTLKVVGGVPPFQALSNNSAVLPVPLSVSGDTIVLVANPVAAGADVPVDITITDLSGQSAVVNVVVRFSPLFASGLIVTPSSSQCGTNVCDGQTATVRATATGVGGAPLPGRQIRFDVVYGPFSILTSNPGAPVSSTVTVVTDASGVAEIQIQATPNTTTQAAQIRATDVTTGQQQIANFTIVRNTTADSPTVVPATAAISAPYNNACSIGFVIDYYIYGGTPPYTIASTFPNGVLISPTVVTQSGGFFRATTNGTCVNPLTFTIVDAAGKNTTATLVNVPGTQAPPGTPGAPSLVVTPSNQLDTACTGTKTYPFVITGGTAPFNVIPSGNPSGITATPNPVPTSGAFVQVTVPYPFPPAPQPFVGTIPILVGDAGTPQQVRTVTITCQ
jgi:hypothetical protein